MSTQIIVMIFGKEYNYAGSAQNSKGASPSPKWNSLDQDRIKFWINLIMIGFSTILGAGYPQVGSIIGLVGSILGLFMMYAIPVAVYLKRYLLELSNPSLVEALDQNRIKTVRVARDFKTPKIAVIEEFDSELESELEAQSGSKRLTKNSIEDKIQEMRNKLRNQRHKEPLAIRKYTILIRTILSKSLYREEDNISKNTDACK